MSSYSVRCVKTDTGRKGGGGVGGGLSSNCIFMLLFCYILHLFSFTPIYSDKREGGDVVQLVEHRTDTPLTQVRFPGAARDFSPRVNFQCRLSYGVRTVPCAVACINICAQV